jgi:hypothetical protein
MKGDAFQPGEMVRVARLDSLPRYNNLVGHVIDLVYGKDAECQPYLVDIGKGRRLMTCACHIDRAEPPAVTLEWYMTVPWGSCAWHPDMNRLPKETYSKLLELAILRRKKARR